MNITQLPREVGILILEYLDVKSKINVYNSCSEFKNFFAACHFKKLVYSRSTIATANSLKQEFFLRWCHFIQDINLSGVPDLTAEALKPLKDRLVHLKTLNITCTNIYLSDLPDICPQNLKNLSINFFKCPRKCITDGVWENCNQLFKEKQFSHVHFVVFEFLDSDIPLIFLKGVPLIEDLQVTVADNHEGLWELEDVPLSIEDSVDANFSKLSYLFRECRFTDETTSRCLKGVSNLDYNNLEYIFIIYMEMITIYVSPVFRSTFIVNCSDLSVEISHSFPLDLILDGNIIFRAWNKSTTNFNDTFFKDLLLELKEYFPSYVCMSNKIKMTITNAPSDWYCIDSCDGFEKKLECLPAKVMLTDFCRKDGDNICNDRPITLLPGAQPVNNITFLRLSNICITEDFFTLLFSQCINLDTLDIYVENGDRPGMFRGYTLSLSKFIHFAKKLRNIKLTSEDIEYDILFEALSWCPTLENVHIWEYDRVIGDAEVDISNMSLFIKRCENLYSLFIQANLSPENLTLFMSLLRENTQKYGRNHMRVEVCDGDRNWWNPFDDVFNPSPLHILL